MEIDGMYTDGKSNIFKNSPQFSQDDKINLRNKYNSKARELFTPGSIASGDMYIKRDDPSGGEYNTVPIETQVEDALLSESFQILLFGDSGVGKTNILIHLASEKNIRYKLINVREGDSASKLVERAVQRLGGQTQELMEHTATEEKTTKFEVGGKYLKLSGGEIGEESFRYISSPTDWWEALSDLMLSENVDLLILDNLQNMRDSEERSKLGSLLEYFYDLRAEYPQVTKFPKIAVAGIASNGEDLIANNDSRQRRIRQIHISHMANEKIGKIAETGFRILEQELAPEAKNLIEFYSDGFPFFAHDLCLAITKLDEIPFTNTIEDHHVTQATALLSASELDSMSSLLHAARGRRSEVRVRANVLDIIATKDWSSWTSRIVHDEWKDRFTDTKTRQSDITNSLNELSGMVEGHERIAILTRTGDGSSGFTYRFRNPHLRPYIRMHPESR